MMTPQLTEQYGHVLRVSLVREILRVFAWAFSGVTSKPNTVIAAPPAIEVCRKARREIAIDSSGSRPLPPRSYTCKRAAARDSSEPDEIELDFLVAVFRGP